MNFTIGTFANLYGKPADNNSDYALNPFWGNQTGSLSATNALVAVLNAENPVPTRTSPFTGGFFIPPQVNELIPGFNFLDSSYGVFNDFNSPPSWSAFSNIDVGDVEQPYATFAVVPPTPIPTPALLPGLLGMGIAAWRKRKNQESEQVAETAEV